VSVKGRISGLLCLATAAMLVGAGGASAAPGDFYSSFEEGEPQPTWTDTVETTAGGQDKASGVMGPRPSGDVTGRVAAVRTSGENPPNEVDENLLDGSPQSKWLTFGSSAWIEVEFAEPVALIRYALTSANDFPDRDPRDWTLSGSDDGTTWTEVDRRTGEEFAQRFQAKQYEFANETAYRHYRIEITANQSGGIIQLAELAFFVDPDDLTPLPGRMASAAGGGPRGIYNTRPGTGFTGLNVLRYAGTHTAEGRAYSYNKVFDVDLPVGRDSELSYVIAPDPTDDDLSYSGTYAAVDLAFTDGTYLSELGATDQHGVEVNPRAQGESKTLYANQWNFKRSPIGEVAAGKTIDRILIAYDKPNGTGPFGGYLDDVKIVGDPPRDTRSRPSDWVVTTRGSVFRYPGNGFSRGNADPMTAVPHGFNYWTPVTDAGTVNFIYVYQAANNAQNLPELQALSLSHNANQWMGERQSFQVMPSAATGEPATDRAARALAFRHENETAKPHHYDVEFENGIEAEIAPTDHAAMFRFRFPDDAANLVFDNINDQASVTIDQDDGVLTGWSDVRSGLSNGATRMFIYATFDAPITAAEAGPRQTGYAKFDAGEDRTVTMRIATSLISLEQARRNLELEIDDDSFADVKARAQEAWDRKLGVVEVEGATDDQRTTLYSNLYRMFLFPNSGYENVGTRSRPRYRHAVQSSTTSPPSTPTETGAPVVDGKVYVNNGFWDTYRTSWPAYSLLAPDVAGELVDGFVQHYRDGGWISRWSSPGYANLMTGTSSDVSFADAYVKGVRGIDAGDTYDAALKNATVAPPISAYDSAVGRKGLVESLFLGWTPSRVPEGVSWGLEGYINDFGIANMAERMARDRDFSREQRERLRDEAEYFRHRAQGYVEMFDPAIGFLQGRAADGEWKSTPEEYDPRVWGHDHDYTETNGWNFAFHAPHDGAGLASLYGGRDGLAAKLDEFFATPEEAKLPGSYGVVIHEMIEARDVRMGQWGGSNEVSLHIPYMYDHTRQPWKTQRLIREAVSRLYIGSEIGQGYPGDEDNGAMSAWHVFSALGFYPLQVGSPYYAIGSPLFRRATIRLGHGRKLVVRAPDNSAKNVYVQGLKVDGRRHDRTYLTHEQIADGGVLEFEMGPRPSRWATGPGDALPSISDEDDGPRPLRDTTGKDLGVATASGETDVAALFDNTAATRVSLAGDDPWVQYRYREDRRQRVRFYTLTSAEGDPALDPRDWVLEGSQDGRQWKRLDERRGETFRWRSQTRPFRIDRDGAYSAYRVRFTDRRRGTAIRLAELELLTTDEVPQRLLSATVRETVASPGDTVPIEVTVTNAGAETATGEISLRVPEGWGVEPANRGFELAGGQAETFLFDLTVPAGATPDAYAIEASVTSDVWDTTASGDVYVGGASIILGDPNDERGLIQIDRADGHTIPLTVEGRSARATVEGDDPTWGRYIYFEVDDDIAFDGNYVAEVEVEYLDEGTAPFGLQYDSTDPRGTPLEMYKSAGQIQRTGSGTWRTATFELPDARFANRQNGGSDFRLTAGNADAGPLTVHRVTLRIVEDGSP
jgi:predicted alpha-1,2-mannosidase